MAKKQTKSTSKRQAMREERKKKERQQRMITLGAVLVIALIIVFIAALPSIQKATAPVGDFVKITPSSYPQADGMKLGNPDAKVRLDIFEDFKCSACKSYADNIEARVISELVATGQVYYVFHQYPFLDVGTETNDSGNAAHASMCAADQNRFWDFKAILFANMNHVAGEFSDARMKAFAKALDLDTSAFNSCYDDKRFEATIEADFNLGKDLGTTGTPSVFVNNVVVSPGFVPTFDAIKEAVDQALAGN